MQIKYDPAVSGIPTNQDMINTREELKCPLREAEKLVNKKYFLYKIKSAQSVADLKGVLTYLVETL